MNDLIFDQFRFKVSLCESEMNESLTEKFPGTDMTSADGFSGEDLLDWWHELLFRHKQSLVKCKHMDQQQAGWISVINELIFTSKADMTLHRRRLLF